jgi:transposase
MARWQTAPCRRDQLALFQERLGDQILADHPVRLLDEILSTHDWSDWESKYNADRGQPAIHPSILCKVLLYAMIRRIRSSRQIEYALSNNIDFIWLVEGRSIDHTTISNFRTAHAEALRGLYRSLCRQAISLGVAKLAEVCIDGSRILGNASRFHTLTSPRTQKLLDELDKQVQAALDELRSNDDLDEVFDEEDGNSLPPEIADLKARQAKLKQLQKQLQEMEEVRRQDGIDPQKNPAQVAPSDADARILPNKTGGYAPNYTPMAITETTNGFIVGADVRIGNVEHTAAVGMIDTLKADYGGLPEAVLGDTAFSTGPNLAEFEARSVNLLSPIRDDVAAVDNPAVREDLSQPVPDDQLDALPLDKQTKRFDKQAFVYDSEKDLYYCRAGQQLPFAYRENTKARGQSVQRKTYQAQVETCRSCPLASRCRTNPNARSGRRVRHDQYEMHRARQRQKMQSEAAMEQYKKRLHYGETQFAVIKQWMGLRQFLLRGIDKVRQEWIWNCTAYNLKKLMSLWRQIGALAAPEAAAINQ